MAAKLKKGDKVVVISGPRKGRGTTRNYACGVEGEIEKVLPKDGKAIVKGVNLVTRHERQTAQSEGGRIRKEAAIDLCKLALVDPVEGGPTRVGFKFIEEGEGDDKRMKKVRFAKKSGTVIDG